MVISANIRLGLAVGIVLVACGGAGSSHDGESSNLRTKIVGGEIAASCAWPTAVSVDVQATPEPWRCTGTLVHPKLVITAAHCLDFEGGPPGPIVVGFGDTEEKTVKDVATERCVANPKWSLELDEHWKEDFAFCTLKEAITEIPIAPVAMGCETDALVEGQEVAAVGFGLLGNDVDNPGGRKHFVFTTIVERDPAYFVIGGNGKSACIGDSGGPAFVELSDGSWRVFASVSAGADCGDPSHYTSLFRAVPWIETESGIDITPCHNAEGAWSPSAECGKFSKNLDESTGTWNRWCSQSAELSGTSMTCGTSSSDSGAGGSWRDSGIANPIGGRESGIGGEGTNFGSAGFSNSGSIEGTAGTNTKGNGSAVERSVVPQRDPGCSCSLPGNLPSSEAPIGLALLGLALHRIRSRRGCQQASQSA